MDELPKETLIGGNGDRIQAPVVWPWSPTFNGLEPLVIKVVDSVRKVNL